MLLFTRTQITKFFAIVFIMAGFLVSQNIAISATTGEVFPSLGTSVSEAPWSNNDWTTPTNIYSDDGATANVTPANYDTGDRTRVLKATGFDFSAIPDGSTINGVTARINSFYRTLEGAGSVDLCQLLDISGAKVGTNQCSTPVALTTTTSTIITKGGASDTWGNSLTTAWIKDPDFGIAIGILATADNADVDVDYVTLEITYTPPASGSVSASPTTCTISSGASTCIVPFTWSISNATSPNLYNATTATTYSTSASGTGVSYPITNGTNTVQARNSTTVLASTSVTGSCISGTTWNGSSCAVVNTSPTLSISQPDGVSDSVTVGSSYDITYSLADAEQVVTAAFYYDTNATGLDGTAISGACATAAEGSGVTCSWNTTGVTPGSYYVYGLTSDGIAAQVSAYSSGIVTINAAPASGSVSASPSTCTILSGASTCTVPFTWSITGASFPNIFNATTANQYSTAASGTGVSYPITNGSNTVQVRDSSAVLNSTTVTGSCTAGTSWNGSSCAAIVVNYNIVASSGANGSVTPSGTTSVAQGASQAYSITPDSGYGVATLVIDSVSIATSTSYTFSNVTEDHTIYATFSLLPVTHTITSSVGSSGGSISPLGATTVADGASQSFTITADSGFVVETLTVDSVSIATSTSYTFTNVITNHTISATFALIPAPPGSFTIVATSGSNGTVSPNGSTIVAEGGSQTYTITPNTGYEIATLIIDSFTVATSTSYTFTNVTADHTIEATFVATPSATTTQRALRPITIVFSGSAFPGAKVSIIDRGLTGEQAIKQEQIANQSGSFEISFIGIVEGEHSFALLVRDKDDRISQSRFFQATLVKEELALNGYILVPPTIGLISSQVSRGKNALIIGYATPGYVIDLELDGIIKGSTTVRPDGIYRIEIPTSPLAFGKHTVRTRQTAVNARKGSEFSTTQTFTVSTLTTIQADLNSDGKIDIRDWSIFLALFASRDAEARKNIDLTNDGKVDISDFSVFIKTIRKK